jgi:DNA-directed RNA polymerase delta subunit
LYNQGGNLPFFRRLPFKRGEGFTPLNRVEYTEINLDNRFNYVGDGLWGLRDWAPKGAATRSVPLATTLRARREKAHRDEDVATDDEDDENARADDIDQIRRDDEGEEEEWEEPEEA